MPNGSSPDRLFLGGVAALLRVLLVAQPLRPCVAHFDDHRVLARIHRPILPRSQILDVYAEGETNLDGDRREFRGVVPLGLSMSRTFIGCGGATDLAEPIPKPVRYAVSNIVSIQPTRSGVTSSSIAIPPSFGGGTGVALPSSSSVKRFHARMCGTINS